MQLIALPAPKSDYTSRTATTLQGLHERYASTVQDQTHLHRLRLVASLLFDAEDVRAFPSLALSPIR
jgi:hypothetical protein